MVSATWATRARRRRQRGRRGLGPTRLDVARHADERLAAERAHVHARRGGQRVAARQHHRQRLARQRRDGEIIRERRHRQAQEADLDAAAAQGVDLARARQLAQLEHEVGVALAQAPHERRQHLVGGGRGVADGERAGVAGRDALHDGARALGLGEQRAGATEQRLAGLGQAHVAAAALEEAPAELLLEAHDLRAQRRLRDGEAARGAPEVELLGDGDERLQEAQLEHEATIADAYRSSQT
ncbi:MAG: hypothetical protein U1F43_05860 [Myxococcota bacterium]